MEGSVLTQTIISAGILPYLLLIPAVLSFSGGPVEISFMNLLNLNTFLPLRCSLHSLHSSNTGGNNLLAVGISLERENYYYLKVLPFDMHQFLERKFWILFAIQSAISSHSYDGDLYSTSLTDLYDFGHYSLMGNYQSRA